MVIYYLSGVVDFCVFANLETSKQSEKINKKRITLTYLDGWARLTTSCLCRHLRVLGGIKTYDTSHLHDCGWFFVEGFKGVSRFICPFFKWVYLLTIPIGQ